MNAQLSICSEATATSLPCFVCCDSGRAHVPNFWERQLNAPVHTKAEPCPSSRHQFDDKDNPHALRILNVLILCPGPREELDNIAGCANGPDLVAGLRSRGLGKEHLPCERINFMDSDGNPCRPGVYSLTSLDIVYEASTTRLGAVVLYLAHKYGWLIQSIDKAAGCNDGRVTWGSEYFLPAEIIARAMAAGAGEWCADVRAARRALCVKATEARRKADSASAARMTRPHPGQWGLFDGGAA
jgi:hypothetical protein